jgi:hypothetical protein
MSMNSSQPNPIADLRRLLMADPKKTGVLALLSIVLLVMAGRILLGGAASGPRSAAASVNNAASTVVGSQAPRPSQASTIVPALQKWVDGPVPPISRNLFAVRVDYFEVDGNGTAPAAEVEEGFCSKLGKSMANQADRIDKRENLIANYTAQASKLRLESIMLGSQPKAMVNGELVGEGSVVAEFRVLKIEARRIVVEREGIQLAIQMK